jgi:hypothetical protein
LKADESNATNTPSPDIAVPPCDGPLPFSPSAPVARLASTVSAACMSRTYTSDSWSGSSSGSSGENVVNETWRPSAEIDGARPTSAGVPAAPDARLASLVVSPTRSRTYTASKRSSSRPRSVVRSGTGVWKATDSPSPASAGSSPDASKPSLSRLASVVVPPERT